MLDFDYPTHYAQLVHRQQWNINLPEQWDHFFEETGIVHPVDIDPDQRSKQRRIVRMRGLLSISQTLPCIDRTASMIGIYTRDFANDSCSIVSPIQLFPEERVRLILPTFWLSLVVVRATRHTETCYEIGLRLLRRHEPDRSAFIVDGKLLRF